MAYSTPRTWVAGEYPTAAQLNANVRDNVSFLANPPACRVYHNATQSITDATETTLAFNSERFDTNTMHDTVTNNSRITFNTAGLYVISCTAEFVSASDYQFIDGLIRLDGATIIAHQSGQCNSLAYSPRITVSTMYKVTAGQYAEVRVFQDNAANAARNVNSTANYSPEFSAVWVGLG